MNKFFKISILFLTITLNLSLNYLTKWIEFKGDNFTIEFPGEPGDQSQTVESAVGKLKLKINMYEAKTEDEENLVYGAISTEYPIEFMKNATKEFNDGIFRGAIDGAVKNVKGKLISEKEIEYKGYQGREFKTDYQDGLAVITMRVYLVKNKMYMLQTIALTKKDNNKSSERFFASFKLN